MTVPMNHEQPHLRKIIRSRVVQLLKENVDVGGRVFPSRPFNLFQLELPCNLVYFSLEEADHQNVVPRDYKRTLTVVTEVLTNFESEDEMSVDDFLDSRAFEIEHALADDRYLGLDNIVQDVILVRTEPMNYTSEGDRQISSLRIFWDVIWRSDFNFQGELAEFLRFNSQYELNVSVSSDKAKAEDMVTIRNE